VCFACNQINRPVFCLQPNQSPCVLPATKSIALCFATYVFYSPGSI
jgi:hypothetical protein